MEASLRKGVLLAVLGHPMLSQKWTGSRASIVKRISVCQRLLPVVVRTRSASDLTCKCCYEKNASWYAKLTRSAFDFACFILLRTLPDSLELSMSAKWHSQVTMYEKGERGRKGGREERARRIKVKDVTCSLVPRLFLPPVFDHLQYAKMEGEGLVHFIM